MPDDTAENGAHDNPLYHVQRQKPVDAKMSIQQI